MDDCRTVSASGQRPRRPLATPPSPLSTSPAIPPPPRMSMPPSRYLGQSTSRTFSHTALRSRDSVSQTDSSMVLVVARRSSPGMDDVRYDWVFPPARDDGGGWPMLPVSGVRSDVASRSGSSRSTRSAASS
jgi:hypothetical protein